MDLTDLERVTTNGVVEVLGPHEGRKFVLALDCSGGTDATPVKRICLGLLQAIERQAGYQSQITVLMFDTRITSCFTVTTRSDPQGWTFRGGGGSCWDCVAEVLRLGRPAINPKLTANWWLDRDDLISVITVTDGMVSCARGPIDNGVRSSIYLTWECTFGLQIPGKSVLFNDERWFLQGSGPSVHSWN